MEVFAVHTVRADELRPTEIVCSELEEAEGHAAVLSQDPGVLAAAVTRFAVNQSGSRSGVSLWVAGRKQAVPYVSDCRTIQS